MLADSFQGISSNIEAVKNKSQKSQFDTLKTHKHVYILNQMPGACNANHLIYQVYQRNRKIYLSYTCEIPKNDSMLYVKEQHSLI